MIMVIQVEGKKECCLVRAPWHDQFRGVFAHNPQRIFSRLRRVTLLNQRSLQTNRQKANLLSIWNPSLHAQRPGQSLDPTMLRALRLPILRLRNGRLQPTRINAVSLDQELELAPTTHPRIYTHSLIFVNYTLCPSKSNHESRNPKEITPLYLIPPFEMD